MTRDEILNMPAGQEMDRLVADSINWNHDHKINGCEDGFYDMCVFCGYQPRFDDVEPGTCDGFPPYSTDIAAAWEVVNKSGVHTLRQVVGEEPDKPAIWQAFVYDDPALSGIGETPELAICHAALLAVMEHESS